MQTDISIFLALGAGVLSFFSPCILPLLPAYLSYMTGVAVEEIVDSRPSRKTILPQVILFCLGFTTVFVLLGATASTLGQAFFRYQRILQWVGGILIILFGLHLMGVLTWRALQMEKRLQVGQRPAHSLGAFVVGIAFAAGWTPCIGPILGGILTFASAQQTLSQGVQLLAVFSLGLAVPFLAVGMAVGSFLIWFKTVKRYMRWVSLASGILLIFMGILLITDNLSMLSQWFLEKFSWTPPL